MLRDSSGDEKEIGNEDAVYFNAAVAVRPVTNKERIRRILYIECYTRTFIESVYFMILCIL